MRRVGLPFFIMRIFFYCHNNSLRLLFLGGGGRTHFLPQCVRPKWIIHANADVARTDGDYMLTSPILVFQSRYWTPDPYRGSWDGSPTRQKEG